MQKRSVEKRFVMHAPFALQSFWSTQGSQFLPVPLQLPKRCAQVGKPRSVSKTPHSPAPSHGHESTAMSQGMVQILAPLLSFAQIWF
jgi:hypothetical protein